MNFSHSYFVLAFLAIIVMFVGSTSTVYAGVDPLKEEDPCFGMFDPTGCGIDDYLLKANMSLPENMKWCGESDKIGFPLLCDVKDPKKQLSFMLVPTNPENGPMEIGITSICDLEPLPYDEAEPLELIVCENPQLILAPISTDDFVSEATGSEDDVKPKSLKEQLANEKINLNMEKVSESERATQQSVLTNKILSPLKQISEGISASDVTCNEGLEKIFKNNDSPICVKSSTAEKLIQRNLAHR